MKRYLFWILIIGIVCFAFYTPKQEPLPLFEENREVTEYGDTIIHNGDGTISIPCGDGNYISMTEEHYRASRKEMKEYNELHKNDPPKKKTKMINIKGKVCVSTWVDAGDLRSDGYGEADFNTNIIVEDDADNWLP